MPAGFYPIGARIRPQPELPLGYPGLENGRTGPAGGGVGAFDTTDPSRNTRRTGEAVSTTEKCWKWLLPLDLATLATQLTGPGRPSPEPSRTSGRRPQCLVDPRETTKHVGSLSSSLETQPMGSRCSRVRPQNKGAARCPANVRVLMPCPMGAPASDSIPRTRNTRRYHGDEVQVLGEEVPVYRRIVSPLTSVRAPTRNPRSPGD